TANTAKGGVTGHPLFQRSLKTGQFESVARGFVDAGSLISLVRRPAGPFVPRIGPRVDALGLSNLKAVGFASRFHGRASRGPWGRSTCPASGRGSPRSSSGSR